MYYSSRSVTLSRLFPPQNYLEPGFVQLRVFESSSERCVGFRGRSKFVKDHINKLVVGIQATS